MTSISRRRFLQTSSAALLFANFPGLARAAQRAAFTIEELAGGVGIFKAQGGTIAYLIDEAGLALVDSQFPRTAKICLNEMRKRTDKPFEFLINTHHHGDHTGGNRVFRDEAKKIVGHENVPKLQKQAKTRGSAPVVPDTTFAKEWQGTVGKKRVRAKHYGPAHTGGDSVITFLDSNIAHMGDLVFNERHPFIDPPAGATLLNWPKVLDAALKDHDAKTQYIFGHGKGNVVLGKAKDVERFRDYLVAVVDTARAAIRAGTSKQILVKRKTLPGFESYIGQGPMSLESSLGAAHDELTAAEEKKKS
ncbi:MAG: MBL fold metallo-hydrolase [Planctomycetota bacterium]